MTPRLAVTQERAGIVDYSAHGGWPELLLRLPERPTMPCDVCLGHGRRWRNGHPDGVQCSCRTGSVPIPEGTRVRIEYPCPECDGKGWWSRWRDDVGYRSVKCKNCIDGSVSVAFATLTEVRVSAERDYHPKLGQLAVDVILSDIKPVEADQ